MCSSDLFSVFEDGRGVAGRCYGHGRMSAAMWRTRSCGAVIYRALTCAHHALTSQVYGEAPQQSLHRKEHRLEETRRITNDCLVLPDTPRLGGSLLPNYLAVAVLMGIRSSLGLLRRYCYTDRKERITLGLRMSSAGRKRSSCVPVM